MLDAEQIEGLRELLAKATPGPWDFTRDDKQLYSRSAQLTIMREIDWWNGPREANAALIVAAVNALPALLAIAEEARRWKKAAEGYSGNLDDTLDRAEKAEAEAEKLKLAILGGEDVPGFAASIATDTVVAIQRENALHATARAEKAEAEAAALREQLADAEARWLIRHNEASELFTEAAALRKTLELIARSSSDLLVAESARSALNPTRGNGNG